GIDDQREQTKRQNVNGQCQDDNQWSQVGVHQRQHHRCRDHRLIVIEMDAMENRCHDEQCQRVDGELRDENEDSVGHDPEGPFYIFHLIVQPMAWVTGLATFLWASTASMAARRSCERTLSGCCQLSSTRPM